MSLVGGLYAKIALDSRTFDAGMRRARGEMDATGKTAKGSFSTGMKFAAGGLLLLAGAAEKSVKAAEEHQVAEASLENALKRVKLSYDVVGKGIDDVILKQSQLSGLTRADLTESYTKFIRVTGNVTAANQLNNAAMNLARARHISLTTASKSLEKAWMGNVGGLSRLGVVLNKNISKWNIASAVNKKYAGAAEAYGKTAQGSQERLGEAVNNLAISFGMILLPAVTRAADYMTKFAEWVQKNGDVVLVFAGVLGVLATALTAGSIAMRIYGTVTKIAAGEQGLLDAALTANPIGIVVVALAALAAGIYLAYKRSETFRAIVSEATDFVRQHWQLLVAMIPGLGIALVIIISHFGTLKSKAATVFGFLADLWSTQVSWAQTLAGWVETVINKISSVADKISGITGAVGGVLGTIRGLASGTHFSSGGLAVVGEHGRELVNLPRGAGVIPAGQTNSILSNTGRGGTSVVVQIMHPNVWGDRASLAEFVRRLQPELDRAVRVAPGSARSG